MNHKVIATFALVPMMLAATACNTMEGVGEDLAIFGRAGNRLVTGRCGDKQHPERQAAGQSDIICRQQKTDANGQTELSCEPVHVIDKC